MGQLPIDFMLNIVAGLAGSILTLWMVERRKRVSLIIDVAESRWHQRPDGSTHRNLLVQVTNRTLPRYLAWAFDGNVAQMCRASVSFFDLSGSPVQSCPMVGRWVSTPEPTKPLYSFDPDNKELFGIPVLRTGDELANVVDIAPGESDELDIAVRFDGESDCFGWNNDSYTQRFRNSNFRLPYGRYYVLVSVMTGGRKIEREFELVNQEEFLLTKKE